MTESTHGESDRTFTLGHLEPSNEPLNSFVLRSFIAPSITWLLGGRNANVAFDRSHQKSPIRPQLNGSHWETSWCISHILDCWDLLNQAPEFTHLCQDIRDRFISENPDCNPIAWLCNEAVEQPDGTARWPGKEYDTAVVSMSLTCLLAHNQVGLAPAVRAQVVNRCKQSQLWLRTYAFQYLRGHWATDHEAPAVIEALLCGLILPAQQKAELQITDHESDEAKFWKCVELWVSFLEKRLGLLALSATAIPHFVPAPATSETSFEKAVIGQDTVRCLCFLAETLIPMESIDNEKAALLTRCRRILSHYLKYLELDLRVTRWGENLNRATKLGLYVRAYRCAANSDGAPHTEVVLGALSLLNTVVFKNGSIFHNTYPTIYFLGSAIQLLKWEKATSKLSSLFSESLDVFVDGLLPGRLHSIELLNETINLRYDLKLKEDAAREHVKKLEDTLAQEKRSRRRTLWWSLNFCSVCVAAFIYEKISPAADDRWKVIGVMVAGVSVLSTVTYNHLKTD